MDRLLQIVVGNFLATFCVWSNFQQMQQLQATFSEKRIILAYFLRIYNENKKMKAFVLQIANTY